MFKQNKPICIILTLIILSLCSCDVYAGKRPPEYDNTKWVSEDPDIYFEINDKYQYITGNSTYGQIFINGIVTEIIISFDYGAGIEFRPISAYDGAINADIWLFKGDCKFSKDKLIVIVTNNEKGWLDDSIKKITFVRYDL